MGYHKTQTARPMAFPQEHQFFKPLISFSKPLFLLFKTAFAAQNLLQKVQIFCS
jgi:hypothetical protein